MFHGLCFPSGLFIRKPSAGLGFGTHRANQHGAAVGKRQPLETILCRVGGWTRPYGHSLLRGHREPPVSASARAPRLPSAQIPYWLRCQQRLQEAGRRPGGSSMLFLMDDRQKHGTSPRVPKRAALRPSSHLSISGSPLRPPWSLLTNQARRTKIPGFSTQPLRWSGGGRRRGSGNCSGMQGSWALGLEWSIFLAGFTKMASVFTYIDRHSEFPSQVSFSWLRDHTHTPLLLL